MIRYTFFCLPFELRANFSLPSINKLLSAAEGTRQQHSFSHADVVQTSGEGQRTGLGVNPFSSKSVSDAANTVAASRRRPCVISAVHGSRRVRLDAERQPEERTVRSPSKAKLKPTFIWCQADLH